jgi:hypothetical protein
MIKSSAEGMTPAEAGEIVASAFDKGETIVHLSGMSFVKRGRFLRNRAMLEVCEKAGSISLSNVDQMDSIERFDGSTEPSPIPDSFHTYGSSFYDPERAISYWNGQPIEEGDTIKLLPVDTIITWAESSPRGRDSDAQTILERLKEPVEFNGIFAPVIDVGAGTVRFDKNIVNNEGALSGVKQLLEIIQEEDEKASAKMKQEQSADGQPELLIQTVKLGRGDALFFDNHKVLHLRKPASTISRLTFRVLLYSLNGSPQGMPANVGAYL